MTLINVKRHKSQRFWVCVDRPHWSAMSDCVLQRDSGWLVLCHWLATKKALNQITYSNMSSWVVLESCQSPCNAVSAFLLSFFMLKYLADAFILSDLEKPLHLKNSVFIDPSVIWISSPPICSQRCYRCTMRSHILLPLRSSCSYYDFPTAPAHSQGD